MTGTPIQVRAMTAGTGCRVDTWLSCCAHPPPPLPQNHMGELFALLHWLNKDVFTSEAAFLAEFGDLGAASEAVRARLTSLLRPHILRRTKEDVLKTLPARHEVLVPVPLSTAQAEMCRMILTRSYELLHVTAGRAAAGPGGRVGKASLINVLMELRKAASHPYLITGAEESLVRRALLDAARAGSADPAAAAAAQAAAPTLALGPDDAYRLFVGVSGKLQFLQRLLPRLAQRGSRVLIFSAFTMVLDILEDFLRGLVMPPLMLPAAAAGASAPADWGDSATAPPPPSLAPPAYRPGRTLLYSRIDGSTDHRMRQRVVDAFNRPASRLFALLMTTRAGGQGLNLATADTVIIFDRSGGQWGGRGRKAARKTPLGACELTVPVPPPRPPAATSTPTWTGACAGGRPAAAAAPPSLPFTCTPPVPHRRPSQAGAGPRPPHRADAPCRRLPPRLGRHVRGDHRPARRGEAQARAARHPRQQGRRRQQGGQQQGQGGRQPLCRWCVAEAGQGRGGALARTRT